MPRIVLLLFIVGACNIQFSYSQSSNRLNEINMVWDKFYRAFDSLDYSYMADIHSKNLIRISGGRILDYKTYIDNYKSNFERLKETGEKQRIELRFFERINNDSTSSERGIYKLVVTNNSGVRKSYYGQFHVIMNKQNGKWLISMDYDSNEGGTVNEERFMQAKAMDNLKDFIKEF